MDAEKFKTVYGESRNGANSFTRHPLVRNFIMSDGVVDAADCGIWWLIDIAATETPALMRRTDESLLCFEATVADNKAVLRATGSGDAQLWTQKVPYTDMPDGKWMFYVGNDGTNYSMILPKEY